MNKQASGNDVRLHLNVPNGITGVRVIMACFVGWFLAQGQFQTAGIILAIAALTDWLDGFVSRRIGKVTLGGALFDLVADELLFMPSLILAIIGGLFTRVDGLMPLNPYLYAVPALLGGAMVLAGVGIYLWKRRTRTFDFPSPPLVAKVNFWFWLTPLIVAVFRVGPDWLLAGLMYLAIISTILTFVSYLRKGSYVFTD